MNANEDRASAAKLRFLIVTESGANLPSGRIRALRYKDHFAAVAAKATFATRRPAGIVSASVKLERLRQRQAARAVSALADRLAVRRHSAIVDLAKNCDVVYLQKTSSADLVRKLKAETKARIVFDLNDGNWLPARRSFAQGRLDEILSSVDAVTCDNPHGAGYASKFNRSTFVVPDPCQVELFDPRRQPRPEGATVTIGWIGSPETAFNLFSIWEPLEELSRRHPHVNLRLVGVGYDPRLLPRWEHVRVKNRQSYDAAGMVDEVLAMDIGIFPLFGIEDSLARGVLKASIYMAGGAAVVAQHNVQTAALIQHEKSGMLASTQDDWLRALEELVTNTPLRRRIAEEGLRHVRATLSTDRCFEQLLHALIPS